MIITTEAVMATKPCPDYPEDRVRELVGDGLDPAAESTLDVVLELPPKDALHVLPRLLTPAHAVVWAQASADRAQGYAADAALLAARCADYTTRATRATRATHAARALTSHYAAEADRAASDVAPYAAGAAHYTRYAADAAYCAYCAAYYANAKADARAAASAEHRLACQHALALIGDQT